MMLVAVPALKDNYIWFLHDSAKRYAVIVDPGESGPALAYLASCGAQLLGILITHHHWDHTQGVSDILQSYPVPVYGPAHSPFELINLRYQDGQQITFAELAMGLSVLAVPGHTLDHIAYVHDDFVLVGDTLFSAGCGRVFEGTHQQMYDSLQQLKQLPKQTQVYCAHEYTLQNIAFAQSIEPDNMALAQHLDQVKTMRSQHQPTLPSTIALEKEINPFFRCDQPMIQQLLQNRGADNDHLSGDPEHDAFLTFCRLRKLKDIS